MYSDTIILDSKDRESYSTSSTDFKIKIPGGGSSRYKAIGIRKVIFQLVMDNVTASNNTYSIDATPGNITAGQYSINSLVDWMTTNIAGYTVTFEDGDRVKITNDSATAFDWVPNETSDLLGFTAASYTGATSYTAERMPNLLPTNYFTLHSDYIHKREISDVHHSDDRSGVVLLIPWVGGIATVMLFEPENPVIKKVTYTNNDIIDFQLRDDSNNTIDIQGKSVILVIDRYI